MSTLIRQLRTLTAAGETTASIAADAANISTEIDNVDTGQPDRESLQANLNEVASILNALGVGGENVFQRFTASLTAQGEIENFDFTAIANPISQKDILDSLYEKGTDPNSNVVFQVASYPEISGSQLNDFAAPCTDVTEQFIYLFPTTVGIANGFTQIIKIDRSTGLQTLVAGSLSGIAGTLSHVSSSLNTTDNTILVTWTNNQAIVLDCNTDTFTNLGGSFPSGLRGKTLYSPVSNAFYSAPLSVGIIYKIDSINVVTAITPSLSFGGNVAGYWSGIRRSNGDLIFILNSNNASRRFVTIDPNTDLFTEAGSNTNTSAFCGIIPIERGNNMIGVIVSDGANDQSRIITIDMDTFADTLSSNEGGNGLGFHGAFVPIDADRYVVIPFNRGQGFPAVAGFNGAFMIYDANLNQITVGEDTSPAPPTPPLNAFRINVGNINLHQLNNGNVLMLGVNDSSNSPNPSFPMIVHEVAAGAPYNTVSNSEFTQILEYTEGGLQNVLRKAQVGVDYELTYNEDGSGNIESVDIEKLQANGLKEIFYNIGTSNGFTP